MARHGAEWAFRFRSGAPGRPRSARTRLRDMKPQRAAAAELVVHEVVLKPNESLHMLLSCSCFSGSGLQRQVIIICVFAPSIFPIARTRRPSESSVEFRLPTPRRSPHDRARKFRKLSPGSAERLKILCKKSVSFMPHNRRDQNTHAEIRECGFMRGIRWSRAASLLAFSVLAPATKVSRSYLPLLPRRALRDHVRGVQRVSLKHEGRHPHCAPSVICRRQEHRRSSS